MVQHLSDVDTLRGLDIASLDFGGMRNSTAGRSLLGAMQYTVEYEFRQFSGDDPSLEDVWDGAAMGLWAASHRRYGTHSGTIDFTTVRQRWLREIIKEWGRSVRPDMQTLRVSLKAFSIASDALARRPGGGEVSSRLNGADMTAVVQAIKDARKDDDFPYAASSLVAFLGGWFNVLDFARSSCLMEDVQGSFSRARHHRIKLTEANEEQAGRALPDVVIQQLDANLHFLTRSHHGWSEETFRLFYRTAYTILRDTGRRIGEVVTLKTGCIEVVDGHPQLIYDNHKARRHGRRLPVTQELADTILTWEKHRAELSLAESALPWLFPSPMHKARGKGRLHVDSLAHTLRDWVRSIPQIDSDIIDPDGEPLPFDRSKITAHAFRHTYAQRHADAGVPVDVLRDLMDHKSMDTTMGYYQVTLKRKREAVKAMAPLAVDRFGNSSPIPAQRYEIGSVAVPFGNCTEPSNVKAGGGSCPIRFQCAGCSFYRPDPSYLPAIEDHVRSLKADKEMADAIGAAPFVLDNLTAQIDSFREVVSTMRGQLRFSQRNDLREAL
ncbi:site-specific integrase [Streptomyces sp. TS71-3]|uniref:tyrosine-type recombinase/integrase n=1 Tax=Streptomyces sp. TS71-3 TaxID=2733862 RepID=UPI001BB3E180|nr:site-specific integrase [Streptomyces sp. TS71-3]